VRRVAQQHVQHRYPVSCSDTVVYPLVAVVDIESGVR
jgi:hypothetical protein